ncbi:MAG TPA: DUF2007 domain-containing protein [Capsulimonadaceae bacterium]|nr:DUF2007 domain-containing protein [Capsulimonadaceae bacterium]
MDASDTGNEAVTSDTPNPAEPGAELEAAAQRQEREQAEIERISGSASPVVVFEASSDDEGQIIRGILESEGIPAIYNDQTAPILGDALSFTTDHSGDVMVSPSDVERAKALIDSYQNATVTDDMVDEADAIEAEE